MEKTSQGRKAAGVQRDAGESFFEKRQVWDYMYNRKYIKFIANAEILQDTYKFFIKGINMITGAVGK